MKKIISLCIVVLSCVSTFSQNNFGVGADSTTEVGVVEHLGDTIPLNTIFINEKNDTVSLGQLINKPTILSFVYFDCPGLCSPLLAGVSDVIEASDMELGKEYQVITISFNTHDNTEKATQKKLNFLKEHSKKHAQHWMYLTGDSTNIFNIANAVGFKFKAVGNDFMHPSCIIIISPSGKITRYLYGLRFLPFDLKMAVIESKKGLTRPSIQKVMEFCFSYDQSGKRYGLDILKISATLIITILLLFVGFLFYKSRLKKKNE